MLDPQDRSLLREALRPPQGFVFDRAVATTFALDLMALLTIPVSFTFFHLKDETDMPAADPLALLESLRRYARRMTIFCQGAQIYLPTRTQPLLAYLEESVFQVASPRRGGLFHPKLTVLRFVTAGGGESEGTVVYRLLCSSRNLTFDRSWDTLLVLEGALARHRRKAFARNHPLARFVRSLPSLVTDVRPDQDWTNLLAMAEELLRVDFENPDGFDDLEFWPVGTEGGSGWPLDGFERTLSVAPFANDGYLKRLTAGGNHQLVSRTESLDELAAESMGRLSAAWYMNPAADPSVGEGGQRDETAGEEPPEDRADAKPVELPAAYQLSGLHAKMFIADDGWNAHVWTGSANATEAAFERNVEFLIRLTGKKSKVGVAAFMSPSQNAGETAADRGMSFADLLLRYERSAPVQADETQAALEAGLEAARVAIAAARFSGAVEQVNNTSEAPNYRLTLAHPPEAPIRLPAEVTAKCHPVTLRPSDALPFPVHGNDTCEIFEPLSFEAITSFFAFHLTARRGDRELACAFVVNVPLAGAPSDREGRILLSLLRNRQQLLRYLLMLLSDDEDASARAIEMLDSDSNGHRGDIGGAGVGFPLLEPLLQTLDRHPARLDQIARLIEDLRKTDEGRKLISDDFLQIWGAVWEARGRLSHA